MTNKFAKKSLLVLLAAGLSLGATMAQAQTTDKGAYLTDVRNEVARSGFGLCWRTGYWTPAAAIAECDPDLVKTATKAAEPVAGVKPASAKITLSADALFDFDKAVLRAEGKSKLDELVTKAKQINLEVIIAVGHADRVGKDAYNQKLSERRAAAVKEYLVSKGIEANRVYTEGKGEKQPVTGDKCGKSEKKTKALIECLQPDRRVEIEVIGTK
ncbi:MAG TPA: OmpA family protein [Azospira sp.]|nr:OmpA family protein [Azospira sp.]